MYFANQSEVRERHYTWVGSPIFECVSQAHNHQLLRCKLQPWATLPWTGSHGVDRIHKDVHYSLQNKERWVIFHSVSQLTTFLKSINTNKTLEAPSRLARINCCTTHEIRCLPEDEWKNSTCRNCGNSVRGRRLLQTWRCRTCQALPENDDYEQVQKELPSGHCHGFSFTMPRLLKLMQKPSPTSKTSLHKLPHTPLPTYLPFKTLLTLQNPIPQTDTPAYQQPGRQPPLNYPYHQKLHLATQVVSFCYSNLHGSGVVLSYMEVEWSGTAWTFRQRLREMIVESRIWGAWRSWWKLDDWQGLENYAAWDWESGRLMATGRGVRQCGAHGGCGLEEEGSCAGRNRMFFCVGKDMRQGIFSGSRCAEKEVKFGRQLELWLSLRC